MRNIIATSITAQEKLAATSRTSNKRLLCASIFMLLASLFSGVAMAAPVRLICHVTYYAGNVPDQGSNNRIIVYDQEEGTVLDMSYKKGYQEQGNVVITNDEIKFDESNANASTRIDRITGELFSKWHERSLGKWMTGKCQKKDTNAF